MEQGFHGFDALSFDCYGTLIDWEAGIARVLEAWTARRGVTLDGESLLAAYAPHEATAEKEYPTALYPEILARTLRGLGEELGVEVTDDDARALGVSVPDWPAFPDSSAALRSLAEHYKLIILSNVDRESFRASNAKLGVEFTSVLTAEDIGSYKPDARNFEALKAEARRQGVADGRLLHVAQSLFHDHIPAHRAGLPTVWINRRHDRAGRGGDARAVGSGRTGLGVPEHVCVRGCRSSRGLARAVAMDLELVNFDQPTEVRTFEKGKFELYRVGPTTLGRATYQPGWRWSDHVGRATGETSCQVEHVGLVLSGQAVAKMDDGREVVMRAGDFFYVPPGHDSWVVGDEPYVSLHILGSETYAAS